MRQLLLRQASTIDGMLLDNGIRRRPDYGDATPEDLARVVLRPTTARMTPGRSPQSGRDTSAASQSDRAPGRSSDPQCPPAGRCASPRRDRSRDGLCSGRRVPERRTPSAGASRRLPSGGCRAVRTANAPGSRPGRPDSSHVGEVLLAGGRQAASWSLRSSSWCRLTRRT